MTARPYTVALGAGLLIVAGSGLLTQRAAGVSQSQAPAMASANWSHPQGDAGATRFSTLDQIDTSNVGQLERAWVFHTGSGRFASSPMVVDGVIYFSAPNGVFALDGVAGEQIWRYAPEPEVEEEPAGGGGRGGRDGRGGGDNIGTAIRGPAYWPGNDDVAPRIYSTTRLGLAAIDAGTGMIVTEFGENGFLLGITPDSYPVFYQNVLITAGPVEDTRGKTVKGFDVVTGQPLWTFYTKAQSDDPNRATWLNGSADTSATPDIWGMFTVDEERGTVFVPVEKVSGNGNNDYWGGGSHGNNLYSDSLVALDALTGEMKWYQQLVHHDIWDYDIAAAPTLIEVRRDGEVIPAVAQYSKMALLFIFHRETGEPIFGLEERPVPQTTVPGEWTSPTQPFPLKPPPLARNTLTRAELSKVTPEHQAFCEDLWDRYNLPDAVPYDPWRTDQDIVVLPGAQGGGNWHGASFNRPLGLMFVTAMNAPQWGRLTEGGGRRGRGAGAAADQDAPNTPPRPRSMSKRTPEQGRFWQGETQWSCTEPPWNELIAIDANTGNVAWRVPLGEFEELIALGVPPTGTPTAGWGITTAGNLIFIGGTTDGFFRAFDARNGEELWRDRLPQPAQSSPTTYMGRDGRQYVVIGANGGGFFRAPTGDEVIAYRLPSGRRP
jgi:quinoprotein glucose dehydrogenase